MRDFHRECLTVDSWLESNIFAFSADAVVIGEDAELGAVMDIELAVDIAEAEDRVHVFSEDGDASVGMNAENAVDGFVAGPGHVHDILGNESTRLLV